MWWFTSWSHGERMKRLMEKGDTGCKNWTPFCREFGPCWNTAVMLAGHLLGECTFQLKRVLMSDVWLSKKREVEGEKWRECVRIDCVQKGMIQQDNTLIFLFLNCNKFPLMYSILQSSGLSCAEEKPPCSSHTHLSFFLRIDLGVSFTHKL